ncbi:MATE family efflux transporter [Fusobacterium perfoetens]|uniref:MATE family efflux transporter n=1 Tax=Fusobacterium perfoetens TaxID=852 RepID=UPI001F350505|nr:MATE family efflux transporter [Fusobacterium perfoetens]MCF2613021.1 MATE family efflux transporter [Fusobacterium perfoetens]
MNRDLTKGNITKTMLLFALPMIAGNILQQFYNIADTFIVGKFLGADALAAVGSSYALMIFLTSILLGLCMGSGALFSIRFGERNEEKLKSSIFVSFFLILAVTVVINIFSFVFINKIINFMRIPENIFKITKDYLWIIFYGIGFTFLYNFFASLLRALGNSVVPLIFLAISAITNIVLDLWFVIELGWGVKGAGGATVIAQGISGVGIAIYTYYKFSWIFSGFSKKFFSKNILKEISQYSFLTCVQQSIMNLGILMVQGLVNSFGTVIMAAFTVAVKIDSFAYMPVQDFGNSFSTFIAQNYGAGESKRIKEGIKNAIKVSTLFCIFISGVVYIFAEKLMLIFVQPNEIEIIEEGIKYLRIEGVFYWGIGCLFLLYGFFRAIEKPGISLILTIVSLGTRVVLSYSLAGIPAIGVKGIWWSIPIGWILADGVGFFYYLKNKRNLDKRKEL